MAVNAKKIRTFYSKMTEAFDPLRGGIRPEAFQAAARLCCRCF